MNLAYAAGFGAHEERVAKGRSALVSTISGLLPERDTHRLPEILICFKPYEPYAHFRRPGRPASRRSRTAASA